MIKSIESVNDLYGKIVLCRIDLNVPIDEDVVVDDFRIKKSLRTLDFLKSKGAKTTIISHIGKDGSQSLSPVFSYIKNKFGIEGKMIDSFDPIDIDSARENQKEGEFLFLENIRKDLREFDDDLSLAKELARGVDIYINDAFSVSHRKHTSIVTVPTLLPSYAGFQILDEIKKLSVVVDSPKRPFFFLLGGAKFKTKEPLVKKYLEEADSVFVGGALANNFFKEMNYEVGTSLIDKDSKVEQFLGHEKLLLPNTVLVEFGNNTEDKKANKVEAGEKIVDIGSEAIEQVKKEIDKSEFILWNGPMGNYEKGYGKATEDILRYIAESNKESIIGGGDTVALVSKLNIEASFSFVSTGGGAMLEYLAKGTLSGIKVLG